MKPIVRAPYIKARGNHGSKKKKKCITRLWDLHIPSELLQEILSRLGPKANRQASVVCKTWFEAAVSVRFQRLPWLFYPSKAEGDYILFDPSRSKIYKKNFPELKEPEPELILYSRDGWLLVEKGRPSESFFLNPFTRERINLPDRSGFSSGSCLAFSAAPTSASCLVISFTQVGSIDDFAIATWRPGETVWTISRHRDQSSSGRWDKHCVFSNGLFYALSNCGFLGVFNPSKATWDVLPVKPWSCDAFCEIDFTRRVLMMEHDGNIFVITRRRKNKNRSVFKLNRERMVWEEKSEAFCLTVFASIPASLTRSCRFPWTNELLGVYCSLADGKGSRLPTSTSFSNCMVWVDPPHNNVNL